MGYVDGLSTCGAGCNIGNLRSLATAGAKIGAVLIVGTLALAIVSHNLWGALGLFGLLGASLLSLLFLLSPALLEARIGHGEPKGDVWWSGGWVEHPSTTR